MGGIHRSSTLLSDKRSDKRCCFISEDRREKLNVYLPDGENLPKVEVKVIDLSNKDGSEGFVQSGSIHVYGRADRKHEAGHPLVHFVVFLQAFKGDR